MSDNGDAEQSANLFELETDAELEIKGVWFKWPTSPTRFKIAAAKNPKFTAKWNALTRNNFHRKWRDDVEGQTRIMIEAMAYAILVDWDGDVIVDKNEGSIKYSRENAIRALNIRPFREWVDRMASDEDSFQAERNASDEAAIKRSVDLEPQVLTKP